MSNPRHTCNKCKQYTPPDAGDIKNPHAGKCALAGDINDGPLAIDRAAGWDYEGYTAGVYVGPKFGCIHWEKRNA